MINLEIDEDLLDQVNDVYIETRYPSDLGLIPDGVPKKEIVTKYHDFAKNVFIQISDYLSQNK